MGNDNKQKKRPYEKPQIHDVAVDLTQALGQTPCTLGSAAGSACSAGGNPGGINCYNGGSAGQVCRNGGGPGTTCRNGGSPGI